MQEIENFNLDEFKKKLRNMARMVHDYPELKGMIGNMNLIDPKDKDQEHTMMSVNPTDGGRRTADLNYNAKFDQDTEEGIQSRRDHAEEQRKMGRKAFNASHMEYSGNHELGHVLHSLLLENIPTLTRKLIGIGRKSRIVLLRWLPEDRCLLKRFFT